MSPLHPADLDALFWKILKNVEQMPYLIFVYWHWGVNFFLVAQIFLEKYQQIISTCGADVKYQVWQVSNVLFLCYLFKFCQLNKKCQIIANQWHQWWHSHMLHWKSWLLRKTITLFTYFIMQYVGNLVVFVQFGWITQLWSLDIFSSATQNIFVHFIT